MNVEAFSKTLRQAPLYWMALASGLLVFALSRALLGGVDMTAPDHQALLDLGIVSQLRESPASYSLVEGLPQTFGAHVLTHVLLSQVSRFTGDVARAGLWLSLVGLTATFAAMYSLCRSIFPLRGFAMVVLVAFGGLGVVQFGLSPDPSAALGMALVTWGVSFFFSALDKAAPGRIFLSGLFIGLAGYIRVELAMIWILLAVYLVVESLYNSPSRSKHLPLVAMALGGMLQVALILWPMIDRNFVIAGSPILPGFDAERIFGAPPGAPGTAGVNLFSRFGHGFVTLATAHNGLGIFAGLLWPVGVGISTFMNRHKAIPFFWVPFVLFWVLLLTLISPLTGPTSFRECMRITSPLLFPFAVLPPMFVVYQWMQAESRPRGKTLPIWLCLGAGAFLMAFLPNLAGPSRSQLDHKAHENLLAFFEGEEPEKETLRGMALLTDRPGLFLASGKSRVFGLNGETDFRIIEHKTADGQFRYTERFVKYLKDNQIGLVHVSGVENPLIPRMRDFLQTLDPSPELARVEGSPEALYTLLWP